ncbi:hypothetical protein FI667_g11510, partial [Globisporangium splendens]
MIRWFRNLCRRKKPKQPKLGPLMALSGWREHREQLIEEERSSKEDGAEISLHGFNSADPLPPISSVDTPPMHAIVELGDGYRPLSPSEARERENGGERKRLVQRQQQCRQYRKAGVESDGRDVHVRQKRREEDQAKLLGVSERAARLGRPDEAERVQAALQNASSSSQDVPESLAIYASANASYCDSNDQVCAACRATWISEYESGSLGIATALGRENGTALSCTGAGGCVCLAYCELREMYVATQFEAAGYVTTCRATSSLPIPVGSVSPTPGPGSSTTNVAQTNNRVGGLDIVIYVFIAGLVAVVLMQITRCISNRCKPIDPSRVQASDWTLRRRRRPPLVRSEPRFGPLLALSGWAAFRERLIEDEREKLELRESEQGEGNEQTPTPILSAVAPRIAVEIGEGFRPESPSQLHRQQPASTPL